VVHVRRAVGFVGVGAGAYALFALACGGAQFEIASDGGTGDDGGPDATCVAQPPAGSEAQLCADEQAILARCGQCASCEQQNLDDCNSFGDSLSAAMKSAIHLCTARIACGGGYSQWAGDPCVKQQLQSASPTAAQQAVRQAYCNQCQAQFPGECQRFYDLHANAADSNGDAGTAGIGVFVLISSDSIASAMGTSCVNATDCNPALFYLCTGGKFCSEAPRDNCDSGFCGK
jgi:hypothetical protein